MISKLTPIEIKVIKLVCNEMTAREIAIKLKLSPRTIQSHIYRVMKRLGIKTNVGLVIMAVKYKLFKIKIK
jgi:DNA-binding CsgD family transcriptional regulator